VVLAQQEIPVDVVQSAFDTADGTTVPNAAPAWSLPDGPLCRTDVLVVNEIELAMTAGLPGGEPVVDVDAIAAVCRSITGPGAVIVTRGRAGAVMVDDGRATAIPAPEVDAIDTTGAGDCFCGVVAGALAEGDDLLEAARVAVRAAALAASRLGARLKACRGGTRATRCVAVRCGADGLRPLRFSVSAPRRR
jgi:ribokinase